MKKLLCGFLCVLALTGCQNSEKQDQSIEEENIVMKSDDEYVYDAYEVANDMFNQLWALKQGTYIDGDYGDYIEANNWYYGEVGGVTMQDLKDKWYQSFDEKYDLFYNFSDSHVPPYIEKDGKLYAADNQVQISSGEISNISMVKQVENEVVFQGTVTYYGEEEFGVMGEDQIEFSLVYHNDQIKYGYMNGSELF